MIEQTELSFLHEDIKEACICIDLENWLKSITGNQDLIFRGRYGEKPFFEQPELFDRTTDQVLLNPDPTPPIWESNAVSAYDLTRMISMLGWHNYISETSQLPQAQWHSLKTIISKAMAFDPARLVDLAIKELGLESLIDSTVIISKLGNGASSDRDRTEAVYVVLAQFVKRNFLNQTAPSAFYTFSMALRAGLALTPRDLNREVVELDARIATEVTEILRRLVMGELAV